MANTTQNWYPSPTGNQATDQALRQAFDHIYSLRDSQPTGLSGTLHLAAPATFNGQPTSNLVFQNGQLVSTS